jgi:hypothetical protein
VIHLLTHPLQVNWHSIDYLAGGTQIQRAARNALMRLRLLESLSRFRPVLTGTIPIACDIPGSDLDIICHASDLQAFKLFADNNFSGFPNYRSKTKELRGGLSVIARFTHCNFELEVVCQRHTAENQYAFGHMIAEALLLYRKGIMNRFAIRKLKQQGLTTEEAFARHFSLPNNPYEHLWKLYIREKNNLSDYS